MDELSGLIQKLQKEVDGLERVLRLREAEEGARLRHEEAELRAAEARLTSARGILKQEADELVVLEEKHLHLLTRIDSWRGRLWRIGYGSLVAAMVPAALTSTALALVWLPSSWRLVWLAAQAGLFGLLYLFIPEKR